jgi:hypothetical protein
MNAKKLLISFRNNKVWFIDVQDWGGGGFCLFGCRQIHKLDREQGRAQNEHAHQKKHGFFSPFSSSILQKQQQHQYNARAWNEQNRESMDSSSSSSSFIIILHMQQQQNAKSVK